MSVILIHGSATHANTGDLAMLRGLIRHLRQAHPDLTPILATRNPETSREQLGIACIASADAHLLGPAGIPPTRSRMLVRGLRFLAVVFLWRHVSPAWAARVVPAAILTYVAQLAGCRAVIVHGSGSFNTIFWSGWLYPKAVLALAARLLGKPVLMTSQGLGPFLCSADRLAARVFCRTAAFIGVRDGDYSRRVALDLGARPGAVFHTGDDSALIPAVAPGHAAALLRREGAPAAGLRIGINFRDASGYRAGFARPDSHALAAALDDVTTRLNCHAVFIPVTYDPLDDDRKSAREVVAHMRNPSAVTVIEGQYEPEEIRGLVGCMDLVVGVSYHFLLFALAQGVPALALTPNAYYLTKHTGLLDLYQQPDCRLDLPATREALAKAIDALLRGRESHATALAARAAELQGLSHTAYAAMATCLT